LLDKLVKVITPYFLSISEAEVKSRSVTHMRVCRRGVWVAEFYFDPTTFPVITPTFLFFVFNFSCLLAPM